MVLTFEQVLTLLAVIGGAAAAIWAVLSKVIIPAMIENRRDKREHEQKRQSLNQAYQMSEVSVTHQMMAELVANSQEKLSEANQYIRQDVKQTIDVLAAQIGALDQIAKDLRDIKYELRNQHTRLQIMTGLVSEMYEYYKKRPVDEIQTDD